MRHLRFLAPRLALVAALSVVLCPAQLPPTAPSGLERARQLNAQARIAATGRPSDTPRVRELTSEAIRLAQPSSDSAEAVSLSILGEQLIGAGEYRPARETLERALALAGERFGQDSPEAADAALVLSTAALPLGDRERARDLSQRALKIFESRFGPDDARVAQTLASLATIHVASGEYPPSIPLFERAIRIEEIALPPLSPQLGKTLASFAFAVHSMGDDARARTIAERAISILDTTGAGAAFTSATGDAHRVMGNILAEMGDYPRARAAQERALEIFESWFGPGSVTVGDDLVGMGNGARAAGDADRAKIYTARAVAIYQADLGPENSRTGGALDNLGQSYVLLKQWEPARACFEQALAIQVKALGPRSPWTANIYQGLAKVAAGQGKYAEAQTLLEHNLEIWREQLGPAHPFTVVSLNLMATILAHRGERAAAMKTVLEAARLRREEIAYTVRTVDERQALRFATRKSEALDTALSLLTATPNPGAQHSAAEDATAVWDELIRSRALVLDEMAARHRSLRQSKDPAAAPLADAEARAREELARLAMQGKGNQTVAQWQQTLDAKREALYRAEESIAAASVRWRGPIERERAGLEQVRQAIPPGAAVVAYVRYNRADFSAPSAMNAPAYLAFVMRAGDSATYAIPLGPSTRIDAQAEAVRREIARERDAQGHSAKLNEAAYRHAGDTLRHSIWDPLAPFVATASALYVVPDGALQLINLQALPVGSNQYLAERGPLLHIISAERDLSRQTVAAFAGVTGEDPAPALLAVGNPAFDAVRPAPIAASLLRGAPSTCTDFAKLRFDALPGAAREVAGIAAIWKANGWPAETLIGPHASEGAVKQSVTGKRVLHFATHGFFLDDDCGGSAVLSENPLLRSGLVLAAANRRGAPTAGIDDGILTAEEVASLDLSAVEWVVLSGCDTGLGDLHAGEGVLGLRRAFQEAGAAAVIGSLWQVEDESAASWMAALYRSHFVDGRGLAQAARSANRAALAARRAKGVSTHPFHWASFVAVERN